MVAYPLVDSFMAIFVFPHLVRIVEFHIDSISKVLVQTFDNDGNYCKKLNISPLFSGFFSSAAMISLNSILSFSFPLLDPHPLLDWVFA